MSDGGGNLSTTVLKLALKRKGKKVGDGECTSFAEEVLNEAQAKTTYDFGVAGPNADYIWGTSVGKPSKGNILQFKDHKATIRIKTSIKFSETDYIEYSRNKSIERPHHTAIAVSSARNGRIKVLEQNMGGKKFVASGAIYILPRKPIKGKVNIKITSAWATNVKSFTDDDGKKVFDAKFVDGFFKAHKNVRVPADVEASVEVEGTVTSFKAQPK